MSGMESVVLIANNFPPVRGGSASVYAALARWSERRILVLAPQLSYTDGLPLIGWREHDRRAGFRVLRIPLLRTTMCGGPRIGARRLSFLLWDMALRVRLALSLLRLVAQGARTVCVGELLASGWIIRLFGLLPGLRVVAYVHGEEITTVDGSDPENRAGRQALKRCDAVVVVSRFTHAAVARLMGEASKERIHLIENGVDNDYFTPGPKHPTLVELYGLDGSFVYVSVCRLVEKKGIDNAIRAFAEVLRVHPDSRYLVVGTGPDTERLREIARGLGAARQVIFAGQVAEDELVEHYRLGDVFVMPNRRMPNGDTEGFGLVFLEANACGLPVVAGRDGGSTDAVRDGENGLVVDGHSVADVTAAMLSLREDLQLYATIRERALRTARQASWREKTRAFLQVCGLKATPDTSV